MSDTENLKRQFVLDIIKNPDCNNLRHIFADWLEDHGGPEGEEIASLIRWMLVNIGTSPTFTYKEEDGFYLYCNGHGKTLYGNPWRSSVGATDKAPLGNWACSMRVAMTGTAETPDSPPFDAKGNFAVIFCRGFVSAASATLNTLQQLLPILATQQPVTRVIVLDKAPRNHGGYYWSWRGHTPGINQFPPRSYDIPYNIFSLMIDDNGNIGSKEIQLEYDSEATAIASLSRALLLDARKSLCLSD